MSTGRVQCERKHSEYSEERAVKGSAAGNTVRAQYERVEHSQNTESTLNKLMMKTFCGKSNEEGANDNVELDADTGLPIEFETP